MATAKTQAKILKTFLKLLEDRRYAELGLTDLAEASGVKLSDLRECFPSKISLVAAFAEMIDKAVLDGRDTDMSDQPARDRLFDILMCRIDMLQPYKEAVRALHEAVRRDPALALDLNPIATRSQTWMLVAAGLEPRGVKGKLIAQGLAVAFSRVVETWLAEDDEGMPRTMARLDRELDTGQLWLERLGRAEKTGKRLRSFISGFSKRRKGSGSRGRPMDDVAPADV